MRFRRSVGLDAAQVDEQEGGAKRPGKRKTSQTVIVLILVLFVVVSGLFVDGAVANLSRSKVDAQWVGLFMGDVNAARTTNGSVPLQVETNLTAFAGFRIQNLTAHYYHPYYGLENDSVKFFGVINVFFAEQILYPSGRQPTAFASFLKSTQPDIWQGLTSDKISKYGFYVGTGPAYHITAGAGCPVTELPQSANVTQYLDSQGCRFTIEDPQWLVIELTG